MKLPIDPHFANEDLIWRLSMQWRTLAQQVNAVTEGRIFAYHAAMTEAPTTGSFAQGDFILNSAPVELGTAGSKYIIHGWRCVASGSPGTWVEMRFLTGA